MGQFIQPKERVPVSVSIKVSEAGAGKNVRDAVFGSNATIRRF